MYTTSEILQLILLVLFFGGIFYYVIFREPASDMVFSSDSYDEINDVEKFLAKNGINTYTKNMSSYRNIMRFPGTPSLHVTDPEDRPRALQLIRNREAANHNKYDRSNQ